MHQIGHKIIHLDVVDSTNNYTANLAKDRRIAHGTVILADEQTNGRGQRGTIWQTQAGMNLIFSLFAEFDDLTIEQQTSIHHWVSLSLCKTLEKLGIETAIKWPNDILSNTKKIAGILIENTLSEKQIKHTVIGIGLNVNQIEFPAGMNATSIRAETGNMVNVKEVAFMLIEELNTRFSKLTNKNFNELKDEYLQKLWGLNQTVNFLRNGVVESGIILGTNEIGKLSVKTQNGIEYFDLKEVSFIVN